MIVKTRWDKGMKALSALNKIPFSRTWTLPHTKCQVAARDHHLLTIVGKEVSTHLTQGTLPRQPGGLQSIPRAMNMTAIATHATTTATATTTDAETAVGIGVESMTVIEMTVMVGIVIAGTIAASETGEKSCRYRLVGHDRARDA
jgi:hypothetical protein